MCSRRKRRRTVVGRCASFVVVATLAGSAASPNVAADPLPDPVAAVTALAVRGTMFQLDPLPDPVAAVAALAVRGTIFQLEPLPPPPPPVTCRAGSLIRGVDTGGVPVIAFSFDDGPWPRNTLDVMSIFESRGLQTTFFEVGINVNAYPSIARNVIDRGFEIGNHSQTHRYIPSIIAAEVPVANSVIQRATGTTPVLFRSPGLTLGGVIQDALASAGMCNISTDTDIRDYIDPRAPAATLCDRFANSLHPGEIVLLHDGGTHRPTVEAVPCMLDIAQARGYQIVTVGRLLQLGTPYENRPSRQTRADTELNETE